MNRRAPRDFRELSRKATAPDATMDDKNELFSAFFELEEWIFICEKDMRADHPLPFTTAIDGKNWIFIFTDSDLAFVFGKMNGEQFLKPDGTIHFLSMNVKNAMEMINDYSGLFGVQINYGLPGWYVPVAGFPAILKHLGIQMGNQ